MVIRDLFISRNKQYYVVISFDAKLIIQISNYQENLESVKINFFMFLYAVKIPKYNCEIYDKMAAILAESSKENAEINSGDQGVTE